VKIMSILKSLIFGSEGSYHVLGIPVDFRKKESSDPFTTEASGIDLIFKPIEHEAGFISKLADKCFNGLARAYMHTAVHEMGHAIAYKLFSGDTPNIVVYSDQGSEGYTHSQWINCLPAWQRNIVSAAGALGNVAFSSCELATAFALKRYCGPLALVLGSGAAASIAQDLIYSIHSTIKQDDGDFGKIAQSNKTHLALAGAALVGECALAALAAYAVS
jgi:hypothetical protein